MLCMTVSGFYEISNLSKDYQPEFFNYPNCYIKYFGRNGFCFHFVNIVKIIFSGLTMFLQKVSGGPQGLNMCVS